jgi:phosphoribosylamine--glycine ligase
MDKVTGDPRKFLFVSRQALIHDPAWEVRKEGHAVRYCILSRSDRDVADGLLDKVDDWEAHKDWADVIVFDDTGFGEAAEKLRREGRAVVGGTRLSDRLEETATLWLHSEGLTGRSFRRTSG